MTFLAQVRKWLGLCEHKWENGGNVLLSDGVGHVRVCQSCGRYRVFRGWQVRNPTR